MVFHWAGTVLRCAAALPQQKPLERVYQDMDRKSRRAVLVFAGAAVLCLAAYLLIRSASRSKESPVPILFLHGLGSGAETWKDASGGLPSKGLRFGAVVRIDGKGEAVIVEGSPAEADFFLIAVSSPFQGLDGWTRDIARLVTKIREATGAPRRSGR